MTYNPEHLRRWNPKPTGFDGWSNYAGPDFSHWYVAPVSQTRDSGVLDRSNFEVVQKDLEQYSTDIIDEDGDEVESVAVHRFGHWGPGWFELILIHESNEKALKAADEWAACLSDYPVADEEHYSRTEYEEITEYWANMSLSDRVDMLQREHGSIFAARHEQVPECCWARLSCYVNE
jgi:hypothetical protein